jgi:hypothetical protein
MASTALPTQAEPVFGSTTSVRQAHCQPEVESVNVGVETVVVPDFVLTLAVREPASDLIIYPLVTTAKIVLGTGVRVPIV